MVRETPACIIFSYMQSERYVYFHIPARVAKECGVVSGARFIGFVRNGRLVLEQETHRAVVGDLKEAANAT